MSRANPAPPRVDFHCALLWLRAMELLVGRSPLLVMSEIEMTELFGRYRSPWRA